MPLDELGVDEKEVVPAHGGEILPAAPVVQPLRVVLPHAGDDDGLRVRLQHRPTLIAGAIWGSLPKTLSPPHRRITSLMIWGAPTVIRGDFHTW